MKKQIAFFVVGAVTLCYGMESPERTLSSFESLPVELKVKIIEAIPSQSETVSGGARMINALSCVNKEFHSYVNDPQTTNNIVTQFETKFDTEITQNLRRLFRYCNPQLPEMDLNLLQSLKKIYVPALLATPGALTVLNHPKVKKEAEKSLASFMEKKTYCRLKQDCIIVCSVLKTTINVNKTGGRYGSTPLHLAADHHDKKAVALLLAYTKIKVNKKDRYGCAPLHLAAAYQCYENIEVVTALLAHPNINVNIQTTKEGWTPLFSAIKMNNKETAAALLAHPKINVNIQDEKGNTPLHKVVCFLCKEIAVMLLKDPIIDVNMKNKNGFTPLNMAEEQSDYKMAEIAKLLKVKGAKNSSKTAFE